MGTKYSQLTYRDRVFIETLLEQQVCPAAIARTIKHDRSTVGREIKRGTFAPLGCYMAEIGQRAHDQGRRRAGLARRKLGTDLSSPAWQPILMGLRAGWSPQQIYGRSRMLDFLLSFAPPARLRVSHETVYKAIFDLPHSPQRADLTRLLRLSRGGRRRSRRSKSRFTGLQNTTSIHQRPLEVLSRDIPGHWEGDIVKGAGGKSFVGTLVERHSRLTLLVYLRSAGAKHVAQAFIRRLSCLPQHMRRSLTYDRGTEMALHPLISSKLRIPIYFCDPYSPWQRPSNENTNGLLRQYLPKGMDLSEITPAQLQVIEDALNNRPRHVLGFYTPREVFQRAGLQATA